MMPGAGTVEPTPAPGFLPTASREARTRTARERAFPAHPRAVQTPCAIDRTRTASGKRRAAKAALTGVLRAALDPRGESSVHAPGVAAVVLGARVAVIAAGQAVLGPGRHRLITPGRRHEHALPEPIAVFRRAPDLPALQPGRQRRRVAKPVHARQLLTIQVDRRVAAIGHRHAGTEAARAPARRRARRCSHRCRARALRASPGAPHAGCRRCSRRSPTRRKQVPRVRPRTSGQEQHNQPKDLMLHGPVS